jgi:tRNA-Thr(GGU) m(6)t(6)A37 methyltransferase TsaA
MRRFNMEIKFQPIGMIHTGYKEKANVPIQPAFSKSKGTVEIFPDYAEGLKDLEGFSHIIIIYYFDKSKEYSLTVTPFLDDEKRGVFATRAPNRPNSIGISIVRLEKIEKNILHISNVDVLDNTPLFDIKPYVKDYDFIEDIRQGWIEGKIKGGHKSDGRFG